MSERLTAKQIKHDIREDEVQSFLLRAVDKFQDNPRLYIGIAVGLLVAALASAGLIGWMNQRNADANYELASAMKVFDAPILEEGETPPEGDKPSFESSEARLAKAKEAFAEVGGGGAKAVAKLYQAEIAIQEGDRDKAREIWENFLKGNEDHVLAVAVRVNLIHLDRQEDRAAEVAERLQRELDQAKKSMPEDVILFELAKTRQTLGEEEQAVELYQRILDEYPQSPYTAEARQATTAAG